MVVFCCDLCGRVLISVIFNNCYDYTEACRLLRVQYQKLKILPFVRVAVLLPSLRQLRFYIAHASKAPLTCLYSTVFLKATSQYFSNHLTTNTNTITFKLHLPQVLSVMKKKKGKILVKNEK